MSNIFRSRRLFLIVTCLAALPVQGMSANSSAPVGADDAYWQTHSLIFAALTGATTAAGDKQPSEIMLRPKLRLSGTLDPGKLPDFSAAINPAKYGPNFNTPAVNSFVLVLVVHSEKGYAVSPTMPDFMPGDHSPICEVKDFTDPKVLDTLKAVQKLRAKELGDKKSDSQK